MFSDLSAERILASHLAESAAPEEPEVSALPRVTQTQFSTGIKMVTSSSYFTLKWILI